MFELDSASNDGVVDGNQFVCLSGDCQSNVFYMEKHKTYCNAEQIDQQCLSFLAELLGCRAARHYFTPAVTRHMDADYLKVYPVDTLTQIWCLLQAFILSALTMVMARLVLHTSAVFYQGCWCRFVIEFVVITLPQILCINIFNSYIKYFVISMLSVLCVVMQWKEFWKNVQNRVFYFDKRPAFITLYRSNVYISSILCILAIDLSGFPFEYRKSRGFGVSMMDAGIGMFVFSMGIVSHRVRNLLDVRKILIPIGALLALGLSRTVILEAIDYHQDEHEYGLHLNAFFILGFTKLFGSLFSLVARSDTQLLPLGLAVLFVHEFCLSNGLNNFVMNPDMERTTFVTANREGLSSIPGYIALYLLSLFARSNLQMKQGTKFGELIEQLKSFAIVVLLLWLMVVFSSIAFGIARVVCNFGYICWILASTTSFLLIFIIAYDVIIDTILPWPTKKQSNDVLQTSDTDYLSTEIPLAAQAINYNGLVYFLLANILTGLVNIFLDTNEVSDLETFFILLIYMFITNLLMFILYKMKFRIA